MKRSAFLLTVDRLGASYLGPYGNTWLETASFNRVASKCQLYEHVTAESLRLEDFVRTMLSRQHALRHTSLPGEHGLPLIDELHNQGIPVVIVTDDEAVATMAQETRVEETILLEANANAVADRLESTTLFHAFASAIGLLEELAGPVWLWMHVGGLNQVWDAPLDYRAAFGDEDDPPPWEGCSPPSQTVSSEIDPDELFQLTMAYAAQVRVLDECLGLFWEQFTDTSPWADSLFMLGGTRGFPLGEHFRVGGADERLFGESLRVPLLIRNPDRPHGSRHRDQIQPVDWSATIAAWFNVARTGSVDRLQGKSLLEPTLSLKPTPADIALSLNDPGYAIRTPAWFFTRSEDSAHLYVKPDDQWEINDVLNRCEDIAADLEQLLQIVLEKARSGDPWVAVPPELEHLLGQVR